MMLGLLRAPLAFFILLSATRSHSLAENVEINRDCRNQTYLAHECSAVHFYKCVQGRKMKMRCPDGLIFDDSRSQCGWPPRGKCVVTFTEDCSPTSVYIPDYGDPTSFYQCSNGAYFKFKCPTELIFNRELNVCDWPKDSGWRRQDSRNCSDPNQCWRERRPLPQKDGWVPVVGSHPTFQDTPHKQVQGWGTDRSYNSLVRWPEENRSWRAQNNVLSAVEDTMENAKANCKENNVTTRVPNGRYHLLTAGSEKTPVGWMQTRPWRPVQPEEGNVIDLSGGKFVQVSVDLSVGVIDISNNLTDYTIHFKPKKGLNANPIETSLIISKDASGITTINSGIVGKDDKANITVKVRG